MDRNQIYVLALSLVAATMGSSAKLSGVSQAKETALPIAWPVALRSQMRRLNSIGYRLGLAAADLCPKNAAGTGLTFDYIGAYRPSDRPYLAGLLGLTDLPQIAAVAQNSPAEIAGAKPGDELVAIDGKPVLELLRQGADPALLADEIEVRIAEHSSTQPLALALIRKGTPLEIHFKPQRVCAARFVLKIDAEIVAFSDGDNVAISYGLVDFARNDDELALDAAHEMGHVIYHDVRARNRAQRWLMESRADAIGVQLSHCAGFDPRKGLELWKRRADLEPSGGLKFKSHPPTRERIALMQDILKDLRCPVQPDPA